MKKIVADVDEELQNATFPNDAILHSVQAELFWRYYQQNRYQILDRTTMVEVDPNDFGTWDINHYVDRVIHHYLKSIENENLLKKIDLKMFDAILVLEKDSKKYRPSLYDFLAHRALDYFTNDESGLTEPVYRFVINSSDYFKPYKDFAGLKIGSQDSLSLKYYALKIMQELISVHQDDTELEALIDIDLKRLEFVKDRGVVEYEDSLYIEALQNLLDKFEDHAASVEVSYNLAETYFFHGQEYDATKSDHNQWDLKKAIEYCEAAIKKFPDSEYTASCESLIETIRNKSLKLITDYATEEETPKLGLLSYKNIDMANFRIIKIDPEMDRDLKQKNRKNELIGYYLDQPIVKMWAVNLPDLGDYQEHSTEIKIPELAYGYYVIIAGNDVDFSFKEDVVAYISFWITNISFISRGENNGNYDFYVLDRDQGSPLSNVEVESFYREYDYSSRSYVMKPWKNFVSDGAGFFSIPRLSGKSGTKSFILKFKAGDDQQFKEDYFYM